MKQILWCCVDYKPKEPHYYLPSLTYFKQDSILKRTAGSTMSWKECKEWGWKCIKVEVIINPIK